MLKLFQCLVNSRHGILGVGCWQQAQTLCVICHRCPPFFVLQLSVLDLAFGYYFVLQFICVRQLSDASSRQSKLFISYFQSGTDWCTKTPHHNFSAVLQMTKSAAFSFCQDGSLFIIHKALQRFSSRILCISHCCHWPNFMSLFVIVIWTSFIVTTH